MQKKMQVDRPDTKGIFVRHQATEALKQTATYLITNNKHFLNLIPVF